MWRTSLPKMCGSYWMTHWWNRRRWVWRLVNLAWSMAVSLHIILVALMRKVTFSEGLQSNWCNEKANDSGDFDRHDVLVNGVDIDGFLD